MAMLKHRFYQLNMASVGKEGEDAQRYACFLRRGRGLQEAFSQAA